MGDLGSDTEVTGGAGNYQARLHQDWEIWGPCGGYVASVALRAAGAELGRKRPVSINVHYLSVAAFDTVDIAVTITRTTKFATAAQVTMTQGDLTVLTAMVWGADDMDGLNHHTKETPHVPHYSDLREVRDLLPEDAPPPQRFWQNLDERPVEWIEDWQNREAAAPEMYRWYHYRPTETFNDPWVDACRQIILLDVDSWGAATRAHTSPMEWFAPTIEFSARFIGAADQHPWLLSVAKAPVAAGGLLACTGEIWTDDQQLVAIGGSTLMCLPNARRPDQ